MRVCFLNMSILCLKNIRVVLVATMVLGTNRLLQTIAGIKNIGSCTYAF